MVKNHVVNKESDKCQINDAFKQYLSVVSPNLLASIELANSACLAVFIYRVGFLIFT